MFICFHKLPPSPSIDILALDAGNEITTYTFSIGKETKTVLWSQSNEQRATKNKEQLWSVVAFRGVKVVIMDGGGGDDGGI